MLILGEGEYLGTIRSATSVGGILIGITEYRSEQGMSPMHYHENPHLSFVLKGLMGVKRKSLSGSDMVLESCSFMHSGEVHQNSIQTGHCKNMNLELGPRFFSKYGIGEEDISRGLLRDGASVPLLLVRIYKELRESDENLVDSVDMLMLEATSSWKSDTVQFPSWVVTVKELLNDRWNEKITLNDIALAARVHPVTISKYFIRYLGMGFGEYRRRLKVSRAIQLISSGSLPLTEVSYACGFFDQSHFIRAFKDSTAMLPKDFRNS